jgi:hypothetical protein
MEYAITKILETSKSQDMLMEIDTIMDIENSQKINIPK